MKIDFMRRMIARSEKRTFRRLAHILAAGTIAWAGFTALNANATTSPPANMTVQASVVASCTVSVTNINFGNYTGAQATGNATVTVTCTNGAPYNVSLDAGTGSGATVATRKMTSGANTLNYSLYQNSGFTTVWGSTVGTNTVPGTGNGSGQGITVYGMMPASQSLTVGSYSDTVVATVVY